MASAPDPRRWSRSLLGWALTLLAAAVALRLAICLLVAIAPLLIGACVLGALIYVVYVINKVRRSRW
jgi:hypothetical protein